MRQALTRTILRCTIRLLLVASVGVAALSAAESSRSGTAAVLSLDGAVGPPTADYLVRGIEAAASNGASAIVLRIDTPGGLDTSMREIVRAILASPVPVLGWVGPGGARAASAGTFILLATHVAAMAPATNLGAATPVPLFGGAPSAPRTGNDRKGDDLTSGDTQSSDPRAAPGSASESKALNDAIAYVRSLAEMRGRNADWAERAVRDAASLSASAAMQAGVIDFVADDLQQLLVKANGRSVRVGNETLVLNTQGLTLQERVPSWKTRLLAAIANPNVALILMMVGVYGLLLEFMSPGALVPGTVGGISLLLGLYSLAALPLNLAGIALLLLGLALLISEAFVPSFGILGIGGAAAFVFGAMILIDGGGVPGFEVAWPLAAGIAAAGLGLGFVVARLAVGSLKHPVRAGEGAMIGQSAEVIDWQGGTGHVHVHGERWRAVIGRSEGASAGPVVAKPLSPGDLVRIAALDGLTLVIERAPPPLTLYPSAAHSSSSNLASPHASSQLPPSPSPPSPSP